MTVNIFNYKKLCRYVAETYENEFVSAAGDSRLIIYCQMSGIETASMTGEIGLHIYQIHILLRIRCEIF